MKDKKLNEALKELCKIIILGTDNINEVKAFDGKSVIIYYCYYQKYQLSVHYFKRPIEPDFWRVELVDENLRHHIIHNDKDKDGEIFVKEIFDMFVDRYNQINKSNNPKAIVLAKSKKIIESKSLAVADKIMKFPEVLNSRA